MEARNIEHLTGQLFQIYFYTFNIRYLHTHFNKSMQVFTEEEL